MAAQGHFIKTKISGLDKSVFIFLPIALFPNWNHRYGSQIQHIMMIKDKQIYHLQMNARENTN